RALIAFLAPLVPTFVAVVSPVTMAVAAFVTAMAVTMAVADIATAAVTVSAASRDQGDRDQRCFRGQPRRGEGAAGGCSGERVGHGPIRREGVRGSPPPRPASSTPEPAAAS